MFIFVILLSALFYRGFSAVAAFFVQRPKVPIPQSTDQTSARDLLSLPTNTYVVDKKQNFILILDDLFNRTESPDFKTEFEAALNGTGPDDWERMNSMRSSVELAAFQLHGFKDSGSCNKLRKKYANLKADDDMAQALQRTEWLYQNVNDWAKSNRAAVGSSSSSSSWFEAPPDFDRDDALERGLWLRGCLILEVCTKEALPLVGSVLGRLHKRAIKDVKKSVIRDLDACEDEEWDCSTCIDAHKEGFTEDAPVHLDICDLDNSGVADHGAPHNLIPCKFSKCCLCNIPANLFQDSDGIGPSTSLFLCRNPADPADTKDIKSSKFIVLRSVSLGAKEPCLKPFRVTRCAPHEGASQFNAVLCSSRPGHTKLLVESFRSQLPLPPWQGELTVGFWALSFSGSEIKELKHGLKPGDFVRFDGTELPSGITAGYRYLVSETGKPSAWCFNVCGFVVCPVVPWAAGRASEFKAIRRSPIAR